MTGSLKIWDGSAWQYVQLPQGGAVVQPGQPSVPTVGMLWYDTDDNGISAGDDTGWLALSPLYVNSFADWDTRTCRYRRKNGVVYIDGVIKGGTAGATAFTLPAGFRCRNIPNYSEYTFLLNSSAGTIVMNVGGSGVVNFSTALPAGGWAYINVSYIQEN